MKFYLAAIFLTIVLNFYVKSSFGFYFGDSTKTECSCTCGDGKICAKTKLILFTKCQCQEGICPNKYKFSGKQHACAQWAKIRKKVQFWGSCTIASKTKINVFKMIFERDGPEE